MASLNAASEGHAALTTADAFSALIKSLVPQRTHPAMSKFVKKLDGLQEVNLPPTLPRMVALSLAERGLIGQFTGLWPSPKTVQRWIERN